MRKFKPSEQDPRFRYSNEGLQTGLNWDYYWGRNRADETTTKVKPRKRYKAKGPVLKKKGR